MFGTGLWGEPRNHKGHWKHRFASVIRIDKFAHDQNANYGEFLDHHASGVPCLIGDIAARHP